MTPKRTTQTRNGFTCQAESSDPERRFRIISITSKKAGLRNAA
jgi:hypothetical protein